MDSVCMQMYQNKCRKIDINNILTEFLSPPKCMQNIASKEILMPLYTPEPSHKLSNKSQHGHSKQLAHNNVNELV